VHCHGSIGTVLDGFVELGADVIHPFEAPPMGDVAPGEAKRALRGRVTLEGNIQIADMYGASSDDIRRQVRALVRDVFDDREGLIVCPTASPYRAGEGALCTRNYRAMIDAVAVPGKLTGCWRGAHATGLDDRPEPDHDGPSEQVGIRVGYKTSSRSYYPRRTGRRPSP